jgi:hypothetical protein
MKKNIVIFSVVVFLSLGVLFQCSDTSKGSATLTPTSNSATSNLTYGGYSSQQEWGEHLVTISACHDCHSPKKMTAQGMEIDSALMLSGHPAQQGPPSVDRKQTESKGQIVTDVLTAWVGPWGISYTANLTSDSTGIGNWSEQQFMYAIRQGKLKGLPESRPLLPPMPWGMYKNMRDEELKAIFAYLKSTKPIKNVVPPPEPPLASLR